MGNIESGPEGSLGAVDSLKHRLQSLEETIRSIEVRSLWGEMALRGVSNNCITRPHIPTEYINQNDGG